jgi:hypothetical protein
LLKKELWNKNLAKKSTNTQKIESWQAPSHSKLNCLGDTQELFYSSCPKLAFDYDEDNMSLVEEPTLTMVEILFFNNSDLSAGYTTIVSKKYSYEIEADEPQFNYHGQNHNSKIRIPHYHNLYH